MKQTKDVRVCVLTTDGTNCDRETVRAFQLAGANVDTVHVNSLMKRYDPVTRRSVSLDDYHILALPGGFSHGDYAGAGKIAAVDLNHYLGYETDRFVQSGKLIFGVCNGFQLEAKAALLPNSDGLRKQTVSLTNNASGRFECRWVKLSKPSESLDRCVWTKGIDRIELPIAHGEGRFVYNDEAVVEQLFSNGQVVFQYVDSDGKPSMDLAHNPSGSMRSVAAICDPTGRIFGLMPHPERYTNPHVHPQSQLQRVMSKLPSEGLGLQIFRNGVEYALENLVR